MLLDDSIPMNHCLTFYKEPGQPEVSQPMTDYPTSISNHKNLQTQEMSNLMEGLSHLRVTLFNVSCLCATDKNSKAY